MEQTKSPIRLANDRRPARLTLHPAHPKLAP